MNQFELNKIRSKLRKLGVGEEIARRYLKKLETDNEPYASAARKIEKWKKVDSNQFILQALVCGFIAAVAGGAIALIN